MQTVEAKQLLTRVKPDPAHFFHADWNMNLYRGCCHGCIYCDSRSLCYHLPDFDTVRVKRGCIPMLDAELRGKKRTGLVSMGSMSDPYNPFEAAEQVTRQALELLARHGFGAAYTTKSALCARDAELMARIGHVSPVRAAITITCADDALCRLVEPRVSPTSQRLRAMRTLADAGVYCGAWMDPMLPFLTDAPEHVERLLVMIRDAGGRFAYTSFGMTLRSGNREYFFKALDRDFPGLKAKYLAAFGNDYECPARDVRDLVSFFYATCQKLGLACRFPEINDRMTAALPAQTRLF